MFQSRPSSPATEGTGVGAARSEAQTSPARGEIEEPFEDEGDLLGGGPLSIGPDEEEEGDGEELFGDNMEK